MRRSRARSRRGGARTRGARVEHASGSGATGAAGWASVVERPFEDPASELVDLRGREGWETLRHPRAQSRRGLGTRMPQSFPPLTATQIDKFRRWILEGALNN